MSGSRIAAGDISVFSGVNGRRVGLAEIILFIDRCGENEEIQRTHYELHLDGGRLFCSEDYTAEEPYTGHQSMNLNIVRLNAFLFSKDLYLANATFNYPSVEVKVRSLRDKRCMWACVEGFGDLYADADVHLGETVPQQEAPVRREV